MLIAGYWTAVREQSGGRGGMGGGEGVGVGRGGGEGRGGGGGQKLLTIYQISVITCKHEDGVPID